MVTSNGASFEKHGSVCRRVEVVVEDADRNRAAIFARRRARRRGLDAAHEQNLLRLYLPVDADVYWSSIVNIEWIDTEQFNVVGRRERHRSPRPSSSCYCSSAMMALAASISVVAVVGLILPFFDDVFTELMNE
jgi:hypothetical protein